MTELNCKEQIHCCLGGAPLDIILGKGENADKQYFLIYPKLFLPY